MKTQSLTDTGRFTLEQLQIKIVARQTTCLNSKEQETNHIAVVTATYNETTISGWQTPIGCELSPDDYSKITQDMNQNIAEMMEDGVRCIEKRTRSNRQSNKKFSVRYTTSIYTITPTSNHQQNVRIVNLLNDWLHPELDTIRESGVETKNFITTLVNLLMPAKVTKRRSFYPFCGGKKKQYTKMDDDQEPQELHWPRL